MYQLTEKRKKVAIIAVILVLVFTIVLGAYWIRRNSDDRSKALTANQVNVTFDKAQYQLPAVGAEFRADVILEVLPTSNVSAAAITINYPTSVLTLNTTKTKAQAANAGDTCNLLDQTLSYSADETTGVIKLVKASYNDEAQLPKGKFCYGALFFTVKSTTTTAATVLKFGGTATTLSDWDIVGKSGRYQVLLGVDAPFGSPVTGTPKPNVNVSFEKASVSLGTVGADLKVNVMFDAATNLVVGGGITVSYPTALVEFNETKTKDQVTNADATCNGLDQVLYVTTDVAAGVARVVKITYKPEAELPKGSFCFASLFFKVKSLSATASSAVSFSGDTATVKDWDIVTKAGRATPVLGSSVKLTAGNITTTPVSTVTPSVTTTTSVTPTTTISTTPTKTPTTTVSPVATATPTVTPSLGCSPPSIYSCQKIKSGTTCQFENKPNGSVCKQDGVFGSCQQGSCDTSVVPTITVDPSTCPRKPEGDADCNGVVNLDDFEIFRNEFVNIRRGMLDLSQTHTDFNDDGFIDIEDFAIFRLTFVNENFTDDTNATPTPSE